MIRTECFASNAINHTPALNPGETDLDETDLGETFLEFVDDVTFPCMGAKFALARGSIEAHEFGTLGDRNNDQPILDGLSRFVDMIEGSAPDESLVHSYVAVFRRPFDMNEFRFESAMWSQLWRMHKLDESAGNLPADDASSDTDSPQFSLSMPGHPFFLIGLHPRASRLDRRFSHPTMVFNSHRQFERLKEDGRFEKMQTATRARDVELQGSINPNLADFGESSEARQYSGREVADNWQYPYDFSQKQ